MSVEPYQWLRERAAALALKGSQLRSVVRDLGIKVVRHRSVIDGEVRRLRNGLYEIRVTSSPVAPRRIRFTVAHELGHVLLDKELGIRPKSRREYWQHERWCDDFAGNLLVPAPALALFNRSDPFGSLDRIVEEYDVSLAVAGVRVADCATDMTFISARLKQDARDERVLRVTTCAGGLLPIVRPNCHLRRTSRLGRTVFAFVDHGHFQPLTDVYYPTANLQFLRRGDEISVFAWKREDIGA